MSSSVPSAVLTTVAIQLLKAIQTVEEDDLLPVIQASISQPLSISEGDWTNVCLLLARRLVRMYLMPVLAASSTLSAYGYTDSSLPPDIRECIEKLVNVLQSHIDHTPSEDTTRIIELIHKHFSPGENN